MAKQDNRWVRCTITAEFLSDAHFGSGSGGGGIDALIARDRHGRPVIWASHVEGVLRDAARRLRGDQEAEAFFGRAGGNHAGRDRQRAVFTSLYAENDVESHIWRSSARKSFDNRAPKDDTLRVVEHVPRGTKLVGAVELPANERTVLQRLVQEVDGLGSGRSAGAGRVKLSLEEGVSAGYATGTPTGRPTGTPTGRLVLLLKNRDPLCITATATPDNLIPSLAFIPGRALLGAVAAWLIAEGARDTASLLTSGRVSVSDALPQPHVPTKLKDVEVLPAPLSLQSEKPKGVAGDVPWWAQPPLLTRRFDKFKGDEKLKRPEDDLFVYRLSEAEAWVPFRPGHRIRLRNGRTDPKQLDPLLFAIEQIVEKTHFLTELQGRPEDLKMVADKLDPILEGSRWLRVGRAGAPVEVVKLAWVGALRMTHCTEKGLLTLTSDLLVRDEYLRWRTALDQAALCDLLGAEVQLHEALQDSVRIHGFNGTARLWRMPAAAIRRGSVFEVSGPGVAEFVRRAANGQWLGERTHEGFGRFRLDAVLPGVTAGDVRTTSVQAPDTDLKEETIAADTLVWFKAHNSLAELGGANAPRPSLSQWFDLVAALESSNNTNAVDERLHPKTAGARGWKDKDAKVVLENLKKLPPNQCKLYARFFVRWLRANAGKRTL